MKPSIKNNYLILVVNIACVLCEQLQNPLVQTLQGAVEGTVLKTRKNQNILSFRGIRYAEAPIGPNRFRPPIPVRSWSGIFDATKDGPICPQPKPRNYTTMSEDCLVLNIYTRNLTGNEPVLVYIHGGGLIYGSGHSRVIAGPQYFLDKDIVLVTINYRLGALGFMSTGNRNAPGNYGFKDQVEALRWVRDNIRVFGGNPKSVTIYGHSSGAMSVTLHMVSPLSRGLFHRVIAASGASTSHIEINNIHWTKRLSKAINCPWLPSSTLMIDCFRSKPYEDLITPCVSCQPEEVLGIMQWNYQIEEDLGVGEFITEHPTKLMATGNFAKVPVMTGITKDEFASYAYKILTNDDFLKSFDENFEEFAPFCFAYEKDSDRSKCISQTLRNFYLANSTIDMFNIFRLEQLFSDSNIAHAVHRFVSLARNYTNIYYYHFNFLGRFSKFYDPDKVPHGVVHADELQYVFSPDGSSNFATMFRETDPENFMVERLTSWITMFAKTGQPNNPFNQWTSSLHWLPSNSTKLIAVNIDKDSQLIDEPYQDRFRVWDRLFPIPYRNETVFYDSC